MAQRLILNVLGIWNLTNFNFNFQSYKTHCKIPREVLIKIIPKRCLNRFTVFSRSFSNNEFQLRHIYVSVYIYVCMFNHRGSDNFKIHEKIFPCNVFGSIA